MAKMRTGALRKLHADLGQILADYDASCTAETGEDNPPEFPGKPAAMDGALSPSARASYDAMVKAAGGTDAYLRLQNNRYRK